MARWYRLIHALKTKIESTGVWSVAVGASGGPVARSPPGVRLPRLFLLCCYQSPCCIHLFQIDSMLCTCKMLVGILAIIVRASIARPSLWGFGAGHLEASSSRELGPQNEFSVTDFAHQLFNGDNDYVSLGNTDSLQSSNLPALTQSYQSQQNPGTAFQFEENNRYGQSIAFTDPSYDLILYEQGFREPKTPEDIFRYQQPVEHQKLQHVALGHERRNFGHGVLPIEGQHLATQNYPVGPMPLPSQANPTAPRDELTLLHSGSAGLIQNLQNRLRQSPLFPLSKLIELNAIMQCNKSHEPISEFIEKFNNIFNKTYRTRRFPLHEFPKMRCGKLLVRYYPEILEGSPTRNGFIQFLNDAEKPESCYCTRNRLETLLGWIWYCHRNLMEAHPPLKLENESKAQASLFKWLWKIYSKPDKKESIPVNGWAKIPEPFDEKAYGISQLLIIEYLTATQHITDRRQKLLDSCVVGLLAAYYDCPHETIMMLIWSRGREEARARDFD